MRLAQGHNAAGEARTRGPSVSSQAFCHCAPSKRKRPLLQLWFYRKNTCVWQLHVVFYIAFMIAAVVAFRATIYQCIYKI